MPLKLARGCGSGMVGLDTNVLVRYLAQDDARQAALATQLIEKQLSATQPGFVSLVVLVELVWVLKRLYGATPAELLDTVQDLANTPQLRLERREVVLAAVRRLTSSRPAKAGLADALVAQLAESEGCARTWTFDKAAASSCGMTLLA